MNEKFYFEEFKRYERKIRNYELKKIIKDELSDIMAHYYFYRDLPAMKKQHGEENGRLQYCIKHHLDVEPGEVLNYDSSVLLKHFKKFNDMSTEELHEILKRLQDRFYADAKQGRLF